MSKRRILILGAGLFQIRGIRLAQQLGLEVLTADNNLGNFGHRFATRSFEIDTLNSQAIEELAKRESVDGIATFASDIAMHTVARVASSMDLPGPSVESVNNLCGKTSFRELLRRTELFCPQFLHIGDSNELPNEARDMRAPLIIKPNRSSGSKGIARVDSVEAPEFSLLLDKARQYSADNCALIEEYVAGVEVGGDARIVDGQTQDIFITQKMTDGFKVIGHRFPCAVTDDQRTKIMNCIDGICRAADYRDGVLNFDIIVNEEEIFVIEVSPRTGGNGISIIIEKTYGVNFEESVIREALGEKYSTRGAFTGTCFGSSIVASAQSGILSQVIASDTENCEYVFSVESGSHVVRWQDNGDPIGFFSFPIGDGESWNEEQEPLQPTLILAS